MEKKEIVYEDGVYSCPVCGSKKVSERKSTALYKVVDANTGKDINIRTGKPYRMSNREKAAEYDNACVDGVGCWSYECRKCGWKSETLVE